MKFTKWTLILKATMSLMLISCSSKPILTTPGSQTSTPPRTPLSVSKGWAIKELTNTKAMQKMLGTSQVINFGRQMVADSNENVYWWVLYTGTKAKLLTAEELAKPHSFRAENYLTRYALFKHSPLKGIELVTKEMNFIEPMTAFINSKENNNCQRGELVVVGVTQFDIVFDKRNGATGKDFALGNRHVGVSCYTSLSPDNIVSGVDVLQERVLLSLPSPYPVSLGRARGTTNGNFILRFTEYRGPSLLDKKGEALLSNPKSTFTALETFSLSQASFRKAILVANDNSMELFPLADFDIGNFAADSKGPLYIWGINSIGGLVFCQGDLKNKPRPCTIMAGSPPRLATIERYKDSEFLGGTLSIDKKSGTIPGKVVILKTHCEKKASQTKCTLGGTEEIASGFYNVNNVALSQNKIYTFEALPNSQSAQGVYEILKLP